MIQVRRGGTGTQPISEGRQGINESMTYQSCLRCLIGVIENQVSCQCHLFVYPADRVLDFDILDQSRAGRVTWLVVIDPSRALTSLTG